MCMSRGGGWSKRGNNRSEDEGEGCAKQCISVALRVYKEDIQEFIAIARYGLRLPLSGFY